MSTNKKQSILVLPADVLAQSDQSIISSIVDFINRGYDRNRSKYNLILSQRIKNSESFFTDLGFDKNQHQSHLFLMIDDWTLITTHFHELFVEFSSKSEPSRVWYTPIKPLPENISFSSAIASIGFKPVCNEPGCFEVTGFTSCKPGAGKDLLQATAKYYNVDLGARRLVAVVIVEHDLLKYYQEIHGFQEVERQLIEKDSVSETLEDGVVARSDFTLAKLVKDF
ncbi:LAFE_0A05842g1_1 [Lachancea fermentati]|uniref:LAFE_0A05842g1_1 n=1 Tax=Lachancea fermentati TaxID=4955 RepID=A0A1G4M6U6_LACFM|nr:LAFE_0A05842g1_1 [Lachancea fermentati]